MIGTAIFMQSSAHLKKLSKNPVSDENQNSVIENGPSHPNEITGQSLSTENPGYSLSYRNNMPVQQNGPTETSLPNGIITNDINLSLNHSTNIILADAIESSKVVPVIEREHEQNSVGSNQSSRASSGGMSQHRQSLPAGMKTGIKSVLKHGNPRDHMLANRPIKTVTFVESVTVVRVM